ncbi:MAG: HesA/MoeB/ThiF family protein [Desulfovibrionales bacterium]|nr:HesA/MoeB/ThiF family protein [Desulfovibrionales bacterium]
MTQRAACFSRNIGPIGQDEQSILARTTAAVIGCGGLGGYVIEHLARMGIGHLRLADPDVFSISNCNRQLNALTATLGHNKAEVAARRVAAIHPFCQVTVFPVDFRQSTVLAKADVVLDCLDDSQTRRDLAQACTAQGIALVHGSVRGWCGQVGVQLPGGTLYECLYPQQRPTGSPAVLSATVGLIASLQAAEALKYILNRPSQLHNAWMYLDLQYGDMVLHHATPAP